MATPTREDAWLLLNEYTQSQRLIRHMLAVEAAMRAYAQKNGEDEAVWGITGLLHDFDYERWPNEARDDTGHPYTGVAMMREKDYPEAVLDAIMGHTRYTGVPRTTPLARTLFAVDELCGLIMAMGYVRPGKLDGLTPKSVKKKLKDKSFAAGVDREEVRLGMEELGVDPTAHMTLIIDAMQSISTELGF